MKKLLILLLITSLGCRDGSTTGPEPIKCVTVIDLRPIVDNEEPIVTQTGDDGCPVIEVA